MIYQIYGFNIVCSRMIESLKDYASEFCDEELPTVSVSEVNDLKNDIVNPIEVNGEYANTFFTNQLCFFDLFDGVNIKISFGNLSFGGGGIYGDRIGEELNGPSIIVLSRFHKRAVLHGSAFLCQDKAYLVLAYPGAGKSTLTTAMVRYHADISFLTDDIICVEENGKVMFRGVHSVNLNDDSLNGLNLSFDSNRKATSCIDIKTDKTKCDMNNSSVEKKTNVIPIGGIILLSEPIANGLIRIQELNKMQSFCEILKNTKMRKTMTSDLLIQEMAVINKMTSQNIPIIKLQIEHDYAKLGEITSRLRDYLNGDH